MEWQPIETAPKDGSCILIVTMSALSPVVDIAHWAIGHEESELGGIHGVWRAGCQYAWEMAEDFAREYIGTYPMPTHWMPLPGIPK